jgi:hypothetical protein
MAAHGTTTGPTDGGTGDGGTAGGSGGQPTEPVAGDNTTGGDIHAYPAGMHAGARMFENSADYADGIESRFLNGTARLHGVWGTDDTGKNFEKSYLQRISNATEALKSIREGLDALPESIDGWATSYEQANEDNATISDDLARGVQSSANPIPRPGSGS